MTGPVVTSPLIKSGSGSGYRFNLADVSGRDAMDAHDWRTVASETYISKEHLYKKGQKKGVPRNESSEPLQGCLVLRRWKGKDS